MDSTDIPVVIKTIPSGKLRRYAHFSWWHYLRHFTIVLKNIFDIFKTIVGLVKSVFILAKFRPDVVFAKGGFVCLPVGYAARLLKVPLVIHDSDARPGLTNKLLARYASAIGTGMPLENYNYNPAISHYVGVPISPEIKQVNKALKSEYRQAFDLPQDKQIVVAVGGGLGSVVINHAMVEAAKSSQDSNCYYVVVSGVKNESTVREASAGLGNFLTIPFVYKDMYKLLGAADLVVSRASATTLQELAGLGQAVVAVPARQLGDQKENAKLFAKYSAVVALQDDSLAVELGDTVSGLLADKNKLSDLATNINQLARPKAAYDMAQIIMELARR